MDLQRLKMEDLLDMQGQAEFDLARAKGDLAEINEEIADRENGRPFSEEDND